MLLPLSQPRRPERNAHLPRALVAPSLALALVGCLDATNPRDGGPVSPRPDPSAAPAVTPDGPAALSDAGPAPTPQVPMDAATPDAGSLDGGRSPGADAALDAGPLDAARLDGGASDATTNNPDATIEGKLVFVTSTRHDGMLGGLDGADAICAARAGEAGLAGQFRAWLSTAAVDASARLAHADQPYVRVDGVPVADDWADLVDGILQAPIDRDEHGQSALDDVWTATGIAGTWDPNGDCQGFTKSQADNGGPLFALCGTTSSDTAAWTSNSLPDCTTSLRLYCLQQ